MQQNLVKLLNAEFLQKIKIPFHCQTELQTYRIFCWPRGNFYHYIGTEDVWGEKYLRKRTTELECKRLLKCKKRSVVITEVYLHPPSIFPLWFLVITDCYSYMHDKTENCFIQWNNLAIGIKIYAYRCTSCLAF